MENLKGKRIDGRYDVKHLKRLDVLSTIYVCYDNDRDKEVEIKIFNDDKITTNSAYPRLKNLLHQIHGINGNCISVANDYSFGDNFSYIVWDAIKGEYLSTFMRNQPALDWYRSVSLIEQLLNALKLIHDKGGSLGNINPNMIIISNGNTLTLTDYCDVNYHELNESAFKLLDKNLAFYYAPEVINNNFDYHADIYSVGVILFELITGKRLTIVDDSFQTILSTKCRRCRKPREIVSSIPLGLEQIVIKALSVEPQNRFNSADDFLKHLKDIKENPQKVFDLKTNNTRRSYFIDFLKPINRSENKMDYRFRCPYCFEEMGHEEVLFRGVTTFRPEEFDKTGQGRQKSDIELIADNKTRNELLKEYERREFFSHRYDEVYHNWYRDHNFGTTSENPGDDEFAIYDRPIIKPNDHGTSGLIYDEDGFAIKIKDPWGEPTMERVCKFCHNPIPMGYGKYPIKYISVIGISGAGKTVYLSKLIQYIRQYTANLDLDATPSPSAEVFVEKNLIQENNELPASTVVKHLEQPLSYNLKYDDNKNETFVIYDIAGENCTNATELLKYGKFVTNSSGIILLIDPKKELGFGETVPVHSLDKVLVNINTLFGKGGLNDIPLAVCISKSDLMHNTLSEVFYDRVTTVGDRFNAEEYSSISRELSEWFQSNARVTKNTLKRNYSTYNFFAFTTLGCATKTKLIIDSDGNEYERDVPIQPPNPKRIEEPLYWLFKQFGYIKATGSIYTPKNEDALAKRVEFVEKIKELQAKLSSFGFFGHRRERREIEEEIAKYQAEINQLDIEIKKYAQ